jgi:hypothetical protein
MLVYSSNNDHLQSIAPTAPPVPPAPPAPPIPPTETGIPKSSQPVSLLDAIKKGTKLRKTDTIDTEATTSKVTLDEIKSDTTGNSNILEGLSNKFNKMSRMIDEEDENNDWEDNNPTPTNLSDKGTEVERSISPEMLDYASDTVNQDKKQKFLDVISIDGNGKEKTSGIAPILKQLKENFPNLSNETLKKLSTPEGLRNRNEILENLPESELIQSKSLSKMVSGKGSIVSKLSNIEKETGVMRIDTLIDVINEDAVLDKDLADDLLFTSVDLKLKDLIDENPGRSKQELVELLIKENPNHKDKILSIVNKTMNDQYSYWESRLSEKDLKKLYKALSKEDWNEVALLRENNSIDQIKTLRAINKSHTNLLNEIKKKPSLISIKENKLGENNDICYTHLNIVYI